MFWISLYIISNNYFTEKIRNKLIIKEFLTFQKECCVNTYSCLAKTNVDKKYVYG